MRLFFLINLLLFYSKVFPQPGKDLSHSFSINSVQLRGEQQIWIHVPEGYDTSGLQYPVLYVLDADGHFSYISQYTDYLAKPFAKTIPPLIVVGIRSLSSAYRLLHFTPPQQPPVPERGNADNFISFLEKELFPEIERRYRTQNERIIAGHSVAGLFALYAMTNNPALFQRVIAISPSLPFGQGIMQSVFIPAWLAQNKKAARLYFSLAENDLTNYKHFCERLRDTLQFVQPSFLKWQYEFFPATDHYSTAPAAFYKGLLSVFKKEE